MHEEAVNKTDPDDLNKKPVHPVASMVSLEAVVNLLINKGICTSEDVVQAEQDLRSLEQELTPAFEQQPVFNPVQISDRTERQDVGGVSHPKKKRSWLKRKMSKQRWSRRLGTFLFGWEWKKVKVNRKDLTLERFNRNHKDVQ